MQISDNGTGMPKVDLKEAMRYGSDSDYNVDSLGKFGLGLKTASLSQCQHLLVISRNNPDRAVISAYYWDVPHIMKSDKWEIIPVNHHELDPGIWSPLKEGTGTVVVWKRLDRILGYQHPYGEMARKRMLSMCRDLEEHLGMVFHRFLVGELRGRKIKILVNGNDVQPWDPYARTEKRTKVLPPVNITCAYETEDGDTKTGKILIEPFILPRENDFSSKPAHERASGPKKWNAQQGLYFYRAGRLIQSGGWSRLRSIDEHTKLARIAISFSPHLDEAFKINVSKMQVYLPHNIREEVKKIVEPVISDARNIYDGHTAPRTQARTTNRGVNTPQPKAPESAPGQVNPPYFAGRDVPETDPGLQSIRLKMWTIDELMPVLLKIAEEDERPVIERLFSRLISSIETSYAEGSILNDI